MDSSKNETKKDESKNIADPQSMKNKESNDSSHGRSIDMSKIVHHATDKEKEDHGLVPFNPSK
jgi:hypothetical protein